MITYYTAIGRMGTKYENGKRVPIIIVENKEYDLSMDELIMWGSLHWNFLNKRDLEKEFKRRKETAHIATDTSFDATLQRLIVRELVAKGTDYLAADALYGLLAKLQIRPVRMSLTDKIKSCVYMCVNKKVPVVQCIRKYFGGKITENERNILRITKNAAVTTSEIIKCAEKNIKNLKDDDDIMDKIYDNPTDTSDTIITDSRFSKLKTDVLQAVANLYLKKKIIFEN